MATAPVETEQPPLADYRVVGFQRKIVSPTPDASLPGGSCFHCGAALINCVTIRHITTGEIHDVGLDCAERTGLDRDGLKALLAERRAAERAEAQQLSAERRRLEEEALRAQHGEHGTLTRFESGCPCSPCRTAAPHGTMTRFEDDNCTCEQCVTTALESGDWRRTTGRVLLDAATGKVFDDARVVDTRFGLRWVLDDPDTDEASWYPAIPPKRRSTMVSKGVLLAEVEMLARRTRHGWLPLLRLSEPTTDVWGEPVPGPD